MLCIICALSYLVSGPEDDVSIDSAWIPIAFGTMAAALVLVLAFA